MLPPPRPDVRLRSMEGQPRGSCIQPPGPAPKLGSKGHREPRSPASFQSTQNKADSGKGHGRNDRKNERKPHRSCELKASSCPVTAPHSSLPSQIHRLRHFPSPPAKSMSTCTLKRTSQELWCLPGPGMRNFQKAGRTGKRADRTREEGYSGRGLKTSSDPSSRQMENTQM